MFRKGSVIWLVLAVSALGVGWSSSALGAANSLKLHAPHSVSVGVTYSLTATGFAAAPADAVVVWEGTYNPGQTNLCATTASAEHFERGGQPLAIDASVSGRFSKKRRESITLMIDHYACGYLINEKTFATYAHAMTSWTVK